MTEQKKQLVFRPSQGKLIKLFLMTIAMVATCFYCTTLDGVVPKIVGWTGVAFFSLAFYTIPKTWLQSNKPAIIFGPDGIEDTRNGFGLVEWPDIAGFELHDVAGTKLLSVRVFEEDKYLQRLSKHLQTTAAGNRKLGFSSITLGFTGLSPDISKALEFIEQRASKS